MESLVVPILILVIVAMGVAAVARSLTRRASADPRSAAPPHASTAGQTPGGTQRELARQASARLTQEQHRRIYALIAQGQAVPAIRVYKESTGQGLRASRDAVLALAAHPQPHQGGQTQAADGAVTGARPERFAYRYRAIASKGDITREVSSNMLNDEIYSDIKVLAAKGDPEAAAASLARHSEISMTEAREFIALLTN